MNIRRKTSILNELIGMNLKNVLVTMRSDRAPVGNGLFKTTMLRQLGLIAIVVRLAYLFQHIGSPFFIRPFLDEHYYDLCARQIAGASGKLIDGFRPLLYPLFLSPFYRVKRYGRVAEPSAR